MMSLPLSGNLVDGYDWTMFLCFLREERPLFSAYMAACDVHLGWDGVLRLRFPKDANFIRERVDKSIDELARLAHRHFGERVQRIDVQQVV